VVVLRPQVLRLVEHPDARVNLVGVLVLLLVDHHPIVYHDVWAPREDLVVQAVGPAVHLGASIHGLVIGGSRFGRVVLREAQQQLLELCLF